MTRFNSHLQGGFALVTLCLLTLSELDSGVFGCAMHEAMANPEQPHRCVDPFERYPHYFDCSRYTQCWYGKGTLLQCPTGSRFDRRLRRCSAGSVECFTQETFECPTRVGLFRHQTHCDRYWLCNGIRSVLRRCPVGMRFDTVASTCRLEKWARCEEISNDNASTDSNVTFTTTEQTNVNSNEVMATKLNDTTSGSNEVIPCSNVTGIDSNDTTSGSNVTVIDSNDTTSGSNVVGSSEVITSSSITVIDSNSNDASTVSNVAATTTEQTNLNEEMTTDLNETRYDDSNVTEASLNEEATDLNATLADSNAAPVTTMSSNLTLEDSNVELTTIQSNSNALNLTSMDLYDVITDSDEMSNEIAIGDVTRIIRNSNVATTETFPTTESVTQSSHLIPSSEVATSNQLNDLENSTSFSMPLVLRMTTTLNSIQINQVTTESIIKPEVVTEAPQISTIDSIIIEDRESSEDSNSIVFSDTTTVEPNYESKITEKPEESSKVIETSTLETDLKKSTKVEGSSKINETSTLESTLVESKEDSKDSVEESSKVIETSTTLETNLKESTQVEGSLKVNETSTLESTLVESKEDSKDSVEESSKVIETSTTLETNIKESTESSKDAVEGFSRVNETSTIESVFVESREDLVDESSKVIETSTTLETNIKESTESSKDAVEEFLRVNETSTVESTESLRNNEASTLLKVDLESITELAQETSTQLVFEVSTTFNIHHQNSSVLSPSHQLPVTESLETTKDIKPTEDNEGPRNTETDFGANLSITEDYLTSTLDPLDQEISITTEGNSLVL